MSHDTFMTTTQQQLVARFERLQNLKSAMASAHQAGQGQRVAVLRREYMGLVASMSWSDGEAYEAWLHDADPEPEDDREDLGEINALRGERGLRAL